MAFSSGKFNFYAQSVDGRWSWSVFVQNVTSFGQSFFVTDVTTPFGAIDVVDSPIPADVVQAMTDSITSVSDQLVPSLTLSSPPLSVTVVEGDEPSIVGTFVVTNSGALGSFLNVASSSDVPWLSTVPALFRGLGQGQQATFSVVVDPASLLFADSPYAGVVTFQDVVRPSSTTDGDVTVAVLPDPVISVPSSVDLTFDLSDCTPGPDQVVDVMNDGPSTSVMSFTISKVLDRSPWLTITPDFGGPVESGDSVPITLSLVPRHVPHATGVYSETLMVSSPTATNDPVYMSVVLTVS